MALSLRNDALHFSMLQSLNSYFMQSTSNKRYLLKQPLVKEDIMGTAFAELAIVANLNSGIKTGKTMQV